MQPLLTRWSPFSGNGGDPAETSQSLGQEFFQCYLTGLTGSPQVDDAFIDPWGDH